MEAKDVIEKLRLIKSPTEGGYYREVYKDVRRLAVGQSRILANDIYYLIEEGEVCALHRVKVPTEIYSFYSGDPVEMVQIEPDGNLHKCILGSDLVEGHVQKVIVPVGTWQGLHVIAEGRWALLGITCVPGFEPEDYEGGSRSDFNSLFPQHREIIRQFTDVE